MVPAASEPDLVPESGFGPELFDTEAEGVLDVGRSDVLEDETEEVVEEGSSVEDVLEGMLLVEEDDVGALEVLSELVVVVEVVLEDEGGSAVLLGPSVNVEGGSVDEGGAVDDGGSSLSVPPPSPSDVCSPPSVPSPESCLLLMLGEDVGSADDASLLWFGLDEVWSAR